MWHKPQTMNAVSELLVLGGAAMLVLALLMGIMRFSLLPPVKTLVVREHLDHIQRADIEQAVQGYLGGNFLSLNLDTVRRAIEGLPWVRRADVRRIWPTQLEVSIEEHIPVARWGEGGNELVNSHGEVFAALLPEADAVALPLLHGPIGTSPEVLQRFGETRQHLAKISLGLVQMRLSSRLAWQLQLQDGMVIELGRERQRLNFNTLLARFIEVYPTLIANRTGRPQVVDLRYPTGFVLRYVPGGNPVQNAQ